jgi:hypothetical protein
MPVLDAEPDVFDEAPLVRKDEKRLFAADIRTSVPISRAYILLFFTSYPP